MEDRIIYTSLTHYELLDRPMGEYPDGRTQRRQRREKQRKSKKKTK